jgi:DNA (cytosine-5)-methyltransferase 1
VTRPIGVDLFAGAGGMSLGFEQAGFDIAAAIEIDPIHCAVHRFNFPQCAILPRSISQVTGDQIRAAARIGSRQIDVVFGGAPCQGFSLIGQRALDDPRNRLVKDFVRIVSELKPKYFVFENVRGLTLGQHRKFLDELILAFSEHRYKIRLPWLVLDAAEYGVPQHRERLILLGSQMQLPLPHYPAPLCNPADCESRLGLPTGPTCRDALGDLPDVDNFDQLMESDETVPRIWSNFSAYARKLHCFSKADWYFGYVRNWNPSILTSSNRTQHTPISKRRFAETLPGMVEPVSRFYKLAAYGLSNTLRAGTDSARGAFTSPRPIHYDHHRCVTVREMARLQGFPDWFRFHATKWHGARQIGNSVPPPLARAIGLSISNALGVKPERPRASIALGDVTLLRMNMSEAAAEFGIPVPIGKRDRKSGSRKRKQHEIEMMRLAAGI